MQKKTYKKDQGKDFGKWTDKTSKLLYDEAMRDIMLAVDIKDPDKNRVGDFGGANNLLKNHIAHSISIDKDKTKSPDIVDNILEHKDDYELGVVRYVLHYLNDYEVLDLINNMNCDRILLIQFVIPEHEMKTKIEISKDSGESPKYFRTYNQLQSLIGGKGTRHFFTQHYDCTKEFYKNRLGINIPKEKEHKEVLCAWMIYKDMSKLQRVVV